MKPPADKIRQIPPSATIEISEKARLMAASGIDVISLSIGEPDFDTPSHIIDAAVTALRSGKTHYAPGRGIPELLSAIAYKTEAEGGFSCSPDNVIVTCGAKNAIYEACEAVLNPGDEVIILDPSWVSYEPCVLLAGGRPVHHPLEKKTFQPDDTLLEAVTDKTKMIIVNSPSNPSGSVLERASLKLIADLCQDHDLYALSDEIYEKLIYGQTHYSLAMFPGMDERTITINGFSKAYAMTGWRLGYAIAPKPILNLMNIVQQHTISHPTTFAMYGGVAALTGSQACVEEMRCEFERRRSLVLNSLMDMDLPYAPADGAFYAFIKVEGDDDVVAGQWLKKAHVAVTPGVAFNTPGWIRMSYAASMDQLRIAMDRIAGIIS
ncbi:MAG: pyridoxal phosphate-dependent aminotransferase [Methanospirillaceae archaeon]|nr:pyridoxal phosphate-dependent aminotransferase [Methanospirillaceae archaeon]